MEFDGVPIGYDGTVKLRKHERVAYTWLVAQKFYGEKASLVVLRDRQVVELAIPDFHSEALLVPIHTFHLPNPNPSYLIVAGLVFTAVTVPFLRSEFGEEWMAEAPVELVKVVTDRRAEFEGEQLVMLTQILAHQLTTGYDNLEKMLVRSINSVAVRNLKHVMELIGACTTTFLRFQLQNNRVIVLNSKHVAETTADVLVKHCIPAATSADLAELQAKSAAA